jgi:hypothetical protein
MIGQHYSVNNEKFYSYYQALDHSKKTGTFVEYVIPRTHIDSFLSVDLEFALNKGLKYWVDKKLNWIFENFKKPKLIYSGGTDSHSILLWAMSLGHQFDSSATFLGSLRNDWEYVDSDLALAKNFLQENSNAVKNAEYFRPTMEMYEQMYLESSTLPYWIPGWWFNFVLMQSPLYMNQMAEADCAVTGHFKPFIVCKDGQYYWMLSGAYDEHTQFSHEISFFGDGYIPEVAVVQAYLAKNFYKTYLPEHSGALTLHLIPHGLRPTYHASLGREPAMSESLAIGTLLGKSPSLNVRNQRAMEEMILLNRIDICNAWNQKRQQLIDDFKDVPYSFRLIKGRTPIDNYQTEIDCPQRILRISAIFRLDQDKLTELSVDIVKDLL